MQETQVRSLSQEDPLEKKMATHSGILAWEIPWRGPWWATVHGVAKELEMTEQINSPADVATSDQFWYLVFPFLYSLKYLKISLYSSFLNHVLFKSV